MKKLFFLCAFLFLSMHIQAQMYIVETWTDWDYQGTSDYDYAIVIHSPSGDTDVINITNYTIELNPIVGSPGTLTETDESIDSYLMKRLNEEINTIISEGYKLLHIELPPRDGSVYGYYSDGWNGGRYFLTVP